MKFNLQTAFAVTWALIAALTVAMFYSAHIKLRAIDKIELQRQALAAHAREPLAPIIDPVEKLTKNDYREISCLAQNMYFEARNQSDNGLMAVGFVTINRTKNTKFSKDICAVIREAEYYPHKSKKGEWVPIKNKCQFSWFCDGKKDEIKDISTWEHVYDLAFHLYLYYNVMEDITKGATHYHGKGISLKWDGVAVRTVSIHNHVFYKMGKTNG